MTTQDMQRTDDLIRTADLAVRASSQLRLWAKRKTIQDPAALEFADRFLKEAVEGGNFIQSTSSVSSFSNLEPLTWTADLQFGTANAVRSEVEVNYEDLVAYILRIQQTVRTIKAKQSDVVQGTEDAASFFRKLGKHLGAMADEQLRSPAARFCLSGDQYSSR